MALISRRSPVGRLVRPPLGECGLWPAVRPGQDLGRPIRVGTVTNPLSWRNARRPVFDEVLGVLNDHREVPHYEVDRLEVITAAVDELAEGGTELIVINGGDGTVQAALTALMRHGPKGEVPLLAVVAGGTTNMTAGDVGAGNRGGATLRAILTEARRGRVEGELTTRRVIEVDTGGTRKYGMFFGAGAVYQGIKFCHSQMYSMGVRGEMGPGIALAVFLASAFRGRANSFLPPLRARGHIDGRPLEHDAYAAIFVSTLEHLFLRLRPFWDHGPGALRYTGVRYHPRHLLRAAPAIMRGKPNRFVQGEHGYTSHNAEEIVLHLDGGFTIDGELFDVPPDQAVRLRADRSAFFLTRPRG